MNAIIRIGNGEYYHSIVLGFYKDQLDNDKWTDRYAIVFNKEKSMIIKQPIFSPEKLPQLDMVVLLTDGNQENWRLDENGYGEVDFLTKQDIFNIIEKNDISNELLIKCIELDKEIIIENIIEVKSEKDIDNLMLVSGYFHDAYVSKAEMLDDKLTVLFEDAWGCSIEIYFSGDVSYCIDSKSSCDFDWWWYTSSIIRENDYIYLVDEEDVTVDDINDNYCWFKAKSMSYRIIPN